MVGCRFMNESGATHLLSPDIKRLLIEALNLLSKLERIIRELQFTNLGFRSNQYEHHTATNFEFEIKRVAYSIDKQIRKIRMIRETLTPRAARELDSFSVSFTRVDIPIREALVHM